METDEGYKRRFSHVFTDSAGRFRFGVAYTPPRSGQGSTKWGSYEQLCSLSYWGHASQVADQTDYNNQSPELRCMYTVCRVGMSIQIPDASVISREIRTC